MLCKSCGREIDAVSRVCPYCGTAVSMSGDYPSASYGQGGNKLKIMCGVVSALHILQIILWFTPYITGTASVYGLSKSASFSMANTIVETGTPEMFTPIFLILFAAGAIFAALPVFTGITKKRRRMIISKIISIITLLFVLLMSGVINSGGSRGVEWSLAFTGWIFVLVPIAIFVLTVIASRTSKQLGQIQ